MRAARRLHYVLQSQVDALGARVCEVKFREDVAPVHHVYCANITDHRCSIELQAAQELPTARLTKAPRYNFTTFGQAVAFELLAICVLVACVVAFAWVLITGIEALP